MQITGCTSEATHHAVLNVFKVLGSRWCCQCQTSEADLFEGKTAGDKTLLEISEYLGHKKMCGKTFPLCKHIQPFATMSDGTVDTLKNLRAKIESFTFDFGSPSF